MSATLAPRHSPSSGYKRGCRCDECRAWYSAWKREWRARGGPATDRERAASRRWKQEHPEHRRALDVALRIEKTGTCQQCGEPMGLGYPDGTCQQCRSEVAHEKRLRIVRLWIAGWSMSEICAELGWSRGSLSSEMSRMRAKGYDLPHRYRRPGQTT